MLIVIAALCLLSHATVRPWRDPQVLLQHALTIQPQSILARTGLMNISLARGNITEARRVITEGIALREDPRLTVQAGILERITGFRQRARQYFTNARHDSPNNPDPLFWLAFMAHEEEDFATAEQFYEAAIVLDPSFVAAHAQLGVILSEREEWEAVQKHVQRGLRFNPNDPLILALHGVLLDREEKYEEAENAFRDAMLLDDHSPHIVRFAAEHARLIGDTEKATRLFQRLERLQGQAH